MLLARYDCYLIPKLSGESVLIGMNIDAQLSQGTIESCIEMKEAVTKVPQWRSTGWKEKVSSPV